MPDMSWQSSGYRYGFGGHKMINKILSYKKLTSYIITICFLFLSANYCKSQDLLNVEYLPIDSLSSKFLEKEIRIDFKSNLLDTFIFGKTAYYIYELMIPSDSIKINIEGKEFIFSEKWIMHLDWFDFNDQTLEETNNNSIDKIYIREMFLKYFDEEKLILEIYIYSYLDVFKNDNEVKEIKTIIIDRKDIKGFLYNISHFKK